MEEKIYSRQVNKLSTSLRVVDEHQIKRYFNTTELADLYEFNPADQDVRETPIVPEVIDLASTRRALARLQRGVRVIDNSGQF